MHFSAAMVGGSLVGAAEHMTTQGGDGSSLASAGMAVLVAGAVGLLVGVPVTLANLPQVRFE